MSEVSENIGRIRERIAAAALRAGRDPKSVRLMAVTKTVSDERILAAIEAGIEIIGENYVQEAKRKIELMGKNAEWHLIGHLQTNKAKYAVRLFDMIHSVNRLSLAEEINRRAAAAGRSAGSSSSSTWAGRNRRAAPHPRRRRIDPRGRRDAEPLDPGTHDHGALVRRSREGEALLCGPAGAARPHRRREHPERLHAGALDGNDGRLRSGRRGRRHHRPHRPGDLRGEDQWDEGRIPGLQGFQEKESSALSFAFTLYPIPPPFLYRGTARRSGGRGSTPNPRRRNSR